MFQEYSFHIKVSRLDSRLERVELTLESIRWEEEYKLGESIQRLGQVIANLQTGMSQEH